MDAMLASTSPKKRKAPPPPCNGEVNNSGSRMNPFNEEGSSASRMNPFDASANDLNSEDVSVLFNPLTAKLKPSFMILFNPLIAEFLFFA